MVTSLYEYDVGKKTTEALQRYVAGGFACNVCSLQLSLAVKPSVRSLIATVGMEIDIGRIQQLASSRLAAWPASAASTDTLLFGTPRVYRALISVFRAVICRTIVHEKSDDQMTTEPTKVNVVSPAPEVSRRPFSDAPDNKTTASIMQRAAVRRCAAPTVAHLHRRRRSPRYRFSLVLQRHQPISRRRTAS